MGICNHTVSRIFFLSFVINVYILLLFLFMENFNSNAFVSDWTVLCFRYLPVSITLMSDIRK
jgi:hypothetical protein